MAEHDTLYSDQLREHLQGFDNDHLAKLAIMYYDRWCWETGHRTDKMLIDLIDEILRERGSFSPVSFDSSTGEMMIGCTSLSIGPNGHTLTGAKQLYDTEFGDLKIGYHLKEAILKMLMTDLEYPGTIFHNGTTLRALIDSIIDFRMSLGGHTRLDELEERIKKLEGQ